MKTRKIRNTYALEYAFYMMAASYFRKAECKRSHHQESRLRLYYQEENRDSQYLMEDFAIHYMEECLMKKAPEEIWEEEVSVHLTRSKDSDATTIQFRNKKVDMKLQLKLLGNLKVRVDCSLSWKGREILQESTKVFSSRSGSMDHDGQESAPDQILCCASRKEWKEKSKKKANKAGQRGRSYIGTWRAA